MSTGNSCIRCGENAEFGCGRCLERYCSMKCQRKDWAVHKKVCYEIPRLIRIETDSDIENDIHSANKQADTSKHELLNSETSVTNQSKLNGSCQSMPTQNGDGQAEQHRADSPKLTQITVLENANEAQSVKNCENLLKEEFAQSRISSKSQAELIANENGHINETGAKAEHTLISRLEYSPLSTEEPKDSVDIKNLPVFFFDDLESKKLKEGENIKLIVTDDSYIDELVLAVIEYNAEHRVQMVKNLKKVEKYCKNAPKLKHGYKPQPNEICLAIYDGDGQWYRAYVMDRSTVTDTYELDFIDYGNVAKVSSSNIMAITEELLFPTCVNFCNIKNVEPKDIPALKAAIAEQHVIDCVVKSIGTEGIYEIFINNLETLLKKK